MNITKDIESSSLVVQWDAVEDFTDTIYTVLWSNGTNSIPNVVTLPEWISYTITGLTLDTVYSITISAGNMCGQGPEFTTSILLAADNTSTTTTTSTKIALPTTSPSTKVTSYYASTTTTTSNEDTTSSEITTTTYTSSIDITSIADTTKAVSTTKTTTTTTTTTIASTNTVAMTTTTSTTDGTTTITNNIVSSIPTIDFDNSAGSTCKFLKHTITQGHAHIQ